LVALVTPAHPEAGTAVLIQGQASQVTDLPALLDQLEERAAHMFVGIDNLLSWPDHEVSLRSRLGW